MCYSGLPVIQLHQVVFSLQTIAIFKDTEFVFKNYKTTFASQCRHRKIKADVLQFKIAMRKIE